MTDSATEEQQLAKQIMAEWGMVDHRERHRVRKIIQAMNRSQREMFAMMTRGRPYTSSELAGMCGISLFTTRKNLVRLETHDLITASWARPAKGHGVIVYTRK